MFGGAGNDIYFVDNAGDAVIENAGEGNDTVFSTAHLRAGGECREPGACKAVPTCRASATPRRTRSSAMPATTSWTAAPAPTLMIGGAGNDTYFVDNAGDAVFEIAGEGNDAVFASVHYGLVGERGDPGAAGQRRPAGLRQQRGNAIFGNTGNNLLNGGGGADTMIGGAGNDTYFVDNAGDAVIENAGAGHRRGVRRRSTTR